MRAIAIPAARAACLFPLSGCHRIVVTRIHRDARTRLHLERPTKQVLLGSSFTGLSALPFQGEDGCCGCAGEAASTATSPPGAECQRSARSVPDGGRSADRMRPVPEVDTPEAGARDFTELREHVGQVVTHRAGTDQQLCTDLPVGEPPRGQPCDSQLLRGEDGRGVPGRCGVAARVLPGQFLFGPGAGEQGRRVQSPEDLRGFGQLGPGVGTATGPPQPLAVQQARAGGVEGPRAGSGNVQREPELLLRVRPLRQQGMDHVRRGDRPRRLGPSGPPPQQSRLFLGRRPLPCLEGSLGGVRRGEHRDGWGGPRGVPPRSGGPGGPAPDGPGRRTAPTCRGSTARRR